jgi:hypothetical protein
LAQEGDEEMTRIPHWTPERVRYLRRAFPAGIATVEIHAALNEMPGPFIAAPRISVKAHRIGVQRPADFTWAKGGPKKKPFEYAAPAAAAPVVPAPIVVARRPVGPPFSMLGGTLGLRR